MQTLCEVVGGGAHATVFRLVNGDILKQFRVDVGVKEEFARQARIHNAFHHLLRRCCDGDTVNSSIAERVRSHIRVSEPLHCDATTLTMRPLMGVSRDSLAPLLATVPPASTTVPDTLPHQVMVHLALNNTESAPQVIGVTPTLPVHPVTNPVRGFFLGGDVDTLEESLERLHCPWTLRELDQMIGFVYGWIYFACALLPLDVELTLGHDPTSAQWHLNVLDFGLCTERGPHSPQSERRLRQRVSDDVYCDLLGNAAACAGFEEARRVATLTVDDE